MDPTHLSFVAIGAIPQVETYKILVLNQALDVKKLNVTINNIKMLEFLQEQGVKIVTYEKTTSMNSMNMDDESQIKQLIKTLEEGVMQLA